MEVRLGYSQTDIGVIPKDWQTTRVGQVCDFIVPGRNKPKLFDGDIPWITTPDLEEGRSVSSSRLGLCISRAEARAVGSKIVPAGSVLMSCAGQLGIVAIAETEIVVNQQLHVFIPTDQVVATFLLNALAYQREQIASCGTKTAVPYLNKGACNAIPIPLPPLSEQRAIAAALSDVDALLGGLDRLIAKKRDLKQTAVQRVLTGQTRLPGFHGEWEGKRLGDVGRCLRGVSYQGDGDLAPRDTAHTKRLLRANNVQGTALVTRDVQFVNEERVSKQQILMKDDILVCMANGSKALVGKAGIFAVSDSHEYTFGAFMGCFRTDATAAHPKFVYSLFQTGLYRDYINNLLAGSSINNLRPSSIESLGFRFPDLSEQAAIASVLADMDAELSALEARRDKTRALKQAMMQELLTGRTRLV